MSYFEGLFHGVMAIGVLPICAMYTTGLIHMQYYLQSGHWMILAVCLTWVYWFAYFKILDLIDRNFTW